MTYERKWKSVGTTRKDHQAHKQAIVSAKHKAYLLRVEVILSYYITNTLLVILTSSYFYTLFRWSLVRRALLLAVTRETM